MTEEELREFMEALESFRAKNAANKEQARKLLRDEGVIDKRGKLTKQYSRKLAKAS